MLFESAASAEVIDVVWRQTGYRAIDPFLEGASAFPTVFNLQSIPDTIVDMNIVDGGKLTPPGMVGLFLKLIFNIDDKFAVMGLQ